MELVRESEDKARSRVEYYETRNAILTAEDVSDLKESQLQEQEQIHMKALLRLSRERVERERRAEHSILKSELQTCKKKIASMRQEKEALEERLRLAEKSVTVLEENEKLRGFNLRLELRVKSQENEARELSKNLRIRTPKRIVCPQTTRLMFECPPPFLPDAVAARTIGGICKSVSRLLVKHW